MVSLIKKRVLLVIVLVVVLSTGGFVVYSKTLSKPSIEMREVSPETARLERGNLDQRVSASGTTAAADEYSIFIELSQEVDKVYAEVGDYVEKGQLLVTYDITDSKKELENKLAEAKITLQNAQLSLSEIITPASGSELLELESQLVNAEKNLSDYNNEIKNLETKISQSETALNNSEKTRNNNKELLAVGGISQYEYDSSEEDYNNAVTALEEARQNKILKEQTLPSLELSIEKAKLNIENGKNKLNDTSIANQYKKQQNAVTTAQMNINSIQDDLNKLTEATYSPISGTVIVSNAVEGQMLTDSTVMMKVADLNNMDVDAYVSEYDIAKIQLGQTVEMTSDGIENKVYTGTVTKIEPTAVSQSTISGSETVVPIKIHMNQVDELVKPGFSFDLEVIVVDLSDINYIPISAVMKNDDGSTYVFEVDDEQNIIKTNVELGTYSDMYVELISGLEETTVFIKTADDKMMEGSNIMEYSKTEGNTTESGSEKSSSVLDSVTGAGKSQGSGMQGGGMPGGGPR